MPNGRPIPAFGREPNEVELAERLRRWVVYYIGYYIERNLKQKDLAHTLGLSQTTISNIKHDNEKAGLVTMVRLHYRLQVPWDDLVSGEPPAHTPTPPLALARKRAS